MALYHLIEPLSSHSGSALTTVSLRVRKPVENSDKVDSAMALSTVALRKWPFSPVSTMYVNDLRIRHSGMVLGTVKARITVVGFDLQHCETQWWEPNHCGTIACGKLEASQCDRENHCSTALYKERIYIRGRARTREGVGADAVLLGLIRSMNFSRACHLANKTWWHGPATGEPIQRNKDELLMLMVSELSEAMEGERKGVSWTISCRIVGWQKWNWQI